jgi:glutaredoxin
MISLLSRLIRPRLRRRAEHLQFTVYTREGCGCCDKALHLLKEYQRQHGFTIEMVDIDADPDLRARFDITVPVVAVDGKVRFKGVVNRVLLERLLWAESREEGVS